MNETKIDWATKSWNPVTGCLHGCPYCYAANQATRFGGWTCGGGWTCAEEKTLENRTGKEPPELDNPLYVRRRNGKEVVAPFPFGFKPTLHRYRLGDPAQMKKPQRIFVGSMADLFGAWVPDAWIEAVFDACKAAPWHTYLFLTKNPRRYAELANARKLPKLDNFWYGSTVTKEGAPFFGGSILHNTFLSIEPLLEPLNAGLGSFGPARWIIVGAMTGPGSKDHQPKREWLENIVEAAGITHAPVFMKENLAGVWGPDLIQDHPKGMVWPEVDGNG